MNTRLRKKLLMVVFCLLVLPATALADGSVIGSCGGTTMTGAANPILGPCVLSGGGSTLYGAQAISGVNSFLNILSPVVVLGGAGQVNVSQVTVTSIPDWQAFGPVLTSLTLSGTVDIFQPGASVNILFTGALGGPPVSISLNFTESTVFSVTVFGNQSMFDMDQDVGELAPPRSTLVVTVNGAASFTGSGEFQGAIPEPATLFLLGTGLTGIAVKLRRKLKKPNGA